MRVKTLDAAKGKWKGILLSLGIPDAALTGKHVPCPLCGGKDRFRFTNNRGDGSYICSQCGHGSGMQLLQSIKGWEFATAAREVDAVIGNIALDATKPELSDADRKSMLNRLWKSGEMITDRDLAGFYWEGRGLSLPQNRQDFRFVASCRATDGEMRPALLAMVRNVSGNPCQLHRTFLSPEGVKAEMPCPRALMPGDIPPGAAIRLAMHGERLGIAEGLETAQRASQRFGIPVWSAINSTLLARWEPPAGVTHVTVFGDNDPKFGGGAAAYALAHRLAVKPQFTVDVRIPSIVGMDWADEAAA